MHRTAAQDARAGTGSADRQRRRVPRKVPLMITERNHLLDVGVRTPASCRESMLVDVDALLAAIRADRPSGARRLRHLRPSRLLAHAAPSTRRTSSPSTQAICEYRERAGIDGPLFLGMRHARALRARVRAPRSRCSPRNGVDVMIDADDGVHADAGHLARDPRRYNRGRSDGARRRHRHHAVAQSAGGRRLQVQPAERRPGDTERHRLDRGSAPTSCSRPDCDGREAHPAARPAAADRHARLRRRLRRRPARAWSTWTRSAARRCSSASTRSAAPSVAYWAPIARALRPRPHRRQRRRRPDLPLHDASTTTARSAWTARRRTPWRG